MEKINIAVVGAGLIGKSHIKLLTSDNSNYALFAIVDPTDDGRELAKNLGVPWYSELETMFSDSDSNSSERSKKLDGVILATPNHLHVEQAIACLEAGIPAIIEKPVAHSLSEGERLYRIAQDYSTPLLVGHHRMHSPIMRKAKELIDSGSLGATVAVTGSALFYKPDDYFELGTWRTKIGGGPILINMIHEIGNLRYLCGEISSVQATASNTHRGFEVEDTVAIVFSFSNGTLGTFILSDTAGSARSWEQTTQENKSYATYPDEDCYHIAGTHGSLSVPTLKLKRYLKDEDRSWWKPFECSDVELERKDPLEAQLHHFCNVIRGQAEPLVSVHDGVQNLRVTEAIVEAVKSGEKVFIQTPPFQDLESAQGRK
ncbi:Gfo/Idh/MocA family protein [Vibrio penaeicida]|uniref:Oxidoreductase n=1 Tax=Vibrio penaeicida TaxID=104609 RepID=A0AAV5NVL9_9VIBR|nr:Gfo/Idh/MocA family oxidoreductase [Vibrio penaeicida]RTZ24459.1 Gfo/Idh/MocA family oxidoreductase [Vibrio penaeicida]GLQ74736.1 oxidoreductase [Vibrio penaeicida]